MEVEVDLLVALVCSSEHKFARTDRSEPVSPISLPIPRHSFIEFPIRVSYPPVAVIAHPCAAHPIQGCPCPCKRVQHRDAFGTQLIQ